jgi:alkylated DNA repair dioxygenase AlkB
MVVSQRSLLGAGEPTIDAGTRFERIDLGRGTWVDMARGWLRGADTLLDTLIDDVEWHQGRRWMYERMVDDPRLSHWYTPGEELPHPVLDPARRALETRYGHPLKGPGINYYRDGRDSVAFHRDRELRHLGETIVAIVTLGAQRPFLIRPRDGGSSRDLSPASGDLLVMGGRAQMDWEHGVPKAVRRGPRLSVTWRWAARPGKG